MVSNSSVRTLSSVFIILLCVMGLSFSNAAAQTSTDNDGIKPLRSDVGINGLTANFHHLSRFTFFEDDTLEMDGSSELEFVFRDVRMLSPRIGVGFEILTSIFTDGPNDGKSFGVGSWGLGPVVRAYPFENAKRLQPYVQAKALMGNNMAVSTMANTKEGGNGFRVRLGLEAGVAYRFTNSFGIFLEASSNWESDRLFRADSRALQLNIGFDLYRFK